MRRRSGRCPGRRRSRRGDDPRGNRSAVTDVALKAVLVIPNLNGRELLGAALESLRAQTREADIVVVDNASTDGAPEMVAERFPEVTLLRNDENVGFGRAVNRGAAAVDADIVIVSNNDVICEPEFVAELCAPFADPAVGMVAGVLTQLRAPDRIDTAGIEFDPTLGAWDYLSNEPVAVLSEETPAPVVPCGGAAAYRGDVWRRLGGFDETIFGFWEDVDLGLRIRAQGLTCALAQAARAEHHHSATWGATSPLQRRLEAFGRGFVLGKYGVRERSLTARLQVTALDWPGLIVHLLARRERAPVRERRRGLRLGTAAREATAAATDPGKLATVGFFEALGRRLAFVRDRFTGGRASHYEAA